MTTSGGASRSYAQLCGIATGLDLIGDRWALLIVRDLLLGPLRFGDLADGLPGIGTNTLTARLKQLEAADVIARRLLDRIPTAASPTSSPTTAANSSRS